MLTSCQVCARAYELTCAHARQKLRARFFECSSARLISNTLKTETEQPYMKKSIIFLIK